MTNPSESRHPTEEFLVVVEGTPLDWGARCRDLARLSLEPEWDGAEPLEAAAALELPPPPGEAPVRVVVLRSGEGEVPLKVRSHLSIEALPGAWVCPLPSRVLGPRTRVFESIVLCEGRRPLLVVDPGRLGSLGAAGASAPPPAAAGPAA